MTYDELIKNPDIMKVTKDKLITKLKTWIAQMIVEKKLDADETSLDVYTYRNNKLIIRFLIQPKNNYKYVTIEIQDINRLFGPDYYHALDRSAGIENKIYTLEPIDLAIIRTLRAVRNTIIAIIDKQTGLHLIEGDDVLVEIDRSGWVQYSLKN